MCGICCIFSSEQKCTEDIINDIFNKFEQNLNYRGPDSQKKLIIKQKNYNFLLYSSVLWLQGEKITIQPCESEKSIFLYNGDIFGTNILTSDLRKHHGDTKLLLDVIESSENILDTLTKIQGPYAFILLDKCRNRLFFARDTFGRRSLLIGKSDDIFVLTSVASKNVGFDMIELPAVGIFEIDLDFGNILLHPWKVQNQHFEDKLKQLENFLNKEITVLKFPEINTIIFDDINDDTFFKKLEILNLNDAFNFVKNNDKYMYNTQKLQSLLEDAIYRRISNQPKFCKNCINEKNLCNHPLIGILFSGGLDCAILSLLADKFIDQTRPIDLMNVAFEKNNFETPDRLTARQTLEELKHLRPNRKWNLLEINVTNEELNYERKKIIGDLIFPLDTILDDSLGCALYFAARGATQNYETPSRVILVGMGADELFGGYTRHKNSFKRGGWTLLSKELDNDWKNISHRNLARDDRVISHHGRQVRTPYLDENLVDFVRGLPAWERCFPTEKLVGFGDKLLLRNLAYDLGLEKAAVLKKRAIQFGSRIANSKENAADKSTRL